MAPMFYRNANVAMLVFDITQPNTFESLKYWVVELKRNVEEAMVLCLVGNKSDLCEKRNVRDFLCFNCYNKFTFNFEF